MGTTTTIICAHCGAKSEKSSGSVNRARMIGAPLYCGKACSGLARRKHKTSDQKKQEKAEYDRTRRAALGYLLRIKKRDARRAKLDADPESVRVAEKRYRESRRQEHLEYCRRPEYREWKREYDRQHRAHKFYGPFAEAFMTLQDLENELAERASKYERYMENGTINKTQKRKRACLIR